MYTLKINKKGQEFIKLRKYKIKQFIYIFPALILLSIFSGIVKLGFSSYSILPILLTFPILIIVFKVGVINPKKFVRNLIIKMEFEDGDLFFFTEEESIKSLNFKLQRNLQIFESTFEDCYIVNFKSKEYYLIPDFFENFELVKNQFHCGII